MFAPSSGGVTLGAAIHDVLLPSNRYAMAEDH